MPGVARTVDGGYEIDAGAVGCKMKEAYKPANCRKEC